MPLLRGSIKRFISTATPGRLWLSREAVARYYQQEARVQDALREQQRVWLTQQARTADGIRIEIAANIAHSVEAQAAFGNGAEGVGLFRTEMLYMDRTSAPGESELYNIFCQALESANGRSIIVRTMDIGGDKPVDYLNIPAEANPFLGYRAVRIYEEYASLFTTQLRSILRASAHGSLKIMILMISSMEEILWVKENWRKPNSNYVTNTFRLMRRSSLALCWKYHR